MFVAMFALIPLARPLFKECNIPWHLFCAAWSLAACSFTMAMIPGVPAIAWINAANGCGVSLTAAPIMGIVGSLIAIVVSCIYIKFALKRAQARGEVAKSANLCDWYAAAAYSADCHYHWRFAAGYGERGVHRHDCCRGCFHDCV